MALPPYDGPERRRRNSANAFNPDDITVINPFKPRAGSRQAEIMDTMRNSLITFLVGPAGTGKTFLSAALAVELMKRPKKDGRIEKVIGTRANVEAGEPIGFLPGDQSDKMDPFLRPFMDNLKKIVDERDVKSLRDQERIETLSMTYMRGLSLDDTLIVLDEAQNATMEQLKLVLTRAGENSRIIVTADPTQIDLKEDKRHLSAVNDFHVFKGKQGIGFIELTEKDVQRSKLTRMVLEYYKQAGR